MTGNILSAAVVAANPGPAAHIALLGIVVVAALLTFGVVRWRRRRDAAEAELHASSIDLPAERGGGSSELTVESEVGNHHQPSDHA